MSSGTGLNVSHYYLVECGKVTNPKDPTIQKLADFYGMTPEKMRTLIAGGR